MPSEEVILSDQRRLIVDAFARFRITDPLRYYQAVGASEEGIRARLNSVVSSSLRRVLGNETLLNVLSTNRDGIMRQIRGQVNGEMTAFGVQVADVRIRRADLPQENTDAILSRMQSERERVARQARAEGAEASAKIHADADRERTVLLADAQAQADRLRGEGEHQAIQTYAKAFQQDPSFFTTWRTLQAYRDSLATGTTQLVLTPDNDFLRLLKTAPSPEPVGAPPRPRQGALPPAGVRRSPDRRSVREVVAVAVEVFAVELEVLVAELAGHGDGAVDAHVVEVVGGEAFEDAGEAGAGAAAAIGEGAGAVGGDAFGVEEAVEQAFGGELVVEQFLVGHGAGQSEGGAPAFFLGGVVEFGVHAALAGHFLQDESAGAPACVGVCAGEADGAAELFAGFEIVHRHVGEGGAFDRHDALVAIHVGALVDGEGEIAGAEQGGGGGVLVGGQELGELVGFGAGIAAERAGFGAIGEQHGHRAVPFRLEGKGAAELERAGEAGREGERLARERGDARVVVMAREQRVGERAEADQAAADGAAGQEEGRDAAGHDDVGHVGPAAVEEGGSFGHGDQDRHGARRLLP